MLFNRVVRSASKIPDMTLPTATVGGLCDACVIKKTKYILKEKSYPLQECYSAVKSDCRHLSERARKNRYCNTF